MLNCPCCSDILLRHLSSGKLYFLCQSCKTQVPAHVVVSEADSSDFLTPPAIATSPSGYDDVAAIKA